MSKCWIPAAMRSLPWSPAIRFTSLVPPPTGSSFGRRGSPESNFALFSLRLTCYTGIGIPTMSRAAELFSGQLTVRPQMAFARRGRNMQKDSEVRPAAPFAPCPFHNGDPVYLAKGSYQGTLGTFLNLRSDPKWADIRELDQSIRAHPVEWLTASIRSEEHQ